MKFKPPRTKTHTHTHTSVGSGSCSTITNAGIMKMSSMSLGGVDGRVHVFVIRSAYRKSMERIYKESDIYCPTLGRGTMSDNRNAV